jgi:DNA-binding IclR family transcriptional regulator
LLKALNESEREMTLQELSKTADLTKTTTPRLLAALESEGLVARGLAQNAYRLGPAIVAMGLQALRTNDLRAAVRLSLEQLAAETGETATLEILSGNQMLILDEAAGRHLVSASIEIGTRWPLHATSTGKALLACLSEEQRRDLLKKSLTSYTSSTETNPQELSRELERIRKNGYATATDELEAGFNAVAAVLLGPMGEPLGAISVGGPSSRVPKHSLRGLGLKLKAVAESISERLGYDGTTDW